jgi:predicted metal-binding membrane protein
MTLTQSRWAWRVPTAVPIGIALAWVAALLATTTGVGAQVYHDRLAHSGLAWWAAGALFLVSWQLMIAAMMLPSSMPLIRLFSIASATQPRRGTVLSAFLGGYATVWSFFGAAAFLGDMQLHRFVDSHPWIQSRPQLIAGGTLLLAGAFQFSTLKEKCLAQCRNPGAYLLARYRRGPAAAFRLGRGHGVFCLGCCWALMLVMFAVGMTSLLWMATLAAVMSYEKTGRHGTVLAECVGLIFLGWGALVLLVPGAEAALGLQ